MKELRDIHSFQNECKALRASVPRYVVFAILSVRLKADTTKLLRGLRGYGNAYAKTELPALIDTYCLPFTA